MADHRARRDLLVFVSDRARRQQRSRLRIMNAATDTAAATSSRFGTFALVFGICFAILYVVCDMASLPRSEEHTSELQSRQYLVCRLLLEQKQLGLGDRRTHLPSQLSSEEPQRSAFARPLLNQP